MKILLTYFGKEMMCENAQQAIEFINSLYYRNNTHCQPLVCNQRVTEMIHDIFAQEWNTDGPGFPFVEARKVTPISRSIQKYYDGHDIRTTGCSTTSIKMYYPLGDTVEEHNTEVARRKAERDEQARKRRDEYLTKRYAELEEKREGWYSVSLTFQHMKYPSMRMTETTFTGKCIASSGMEAYHKAVADIESRGELSMGAIFPEPTSEGGYSFLYLGVKTDEGYTFEPMA